MVSPLTPMATSGLPTGTRSFLRSFNESHNLLRNGWKVTRYRPDGSVERVLKIPAQRPTSVMFGGKDLGILYITSASKDIGEAAPLGGDFPHGALFAIKVEGVKGFPEPAYLG